jgi:hypothetical protein
MAARSAIRHNKGTLHKWFGPNRGTHWNIAGAVAVIVLGGYFIYSNRDRTPTTAASISATEPSSRAIAPALPAPPSEK